jgi:hypothetical protein
VILAIAKACEAEPVLNTWFVSESMSIRICKQVDLGYGPQRSGLHTARRVGFQRGASDVKPMWELIGAPSAVNQHTWSFSVGRSKAA